MTAQRATRWTHHLNRSPAAVDRHECTPTLGAHVTTIDTDQFAGYLALHGKADATIRNYRALYARWCDWATTHRRDPARPDPLAVRAWASQLHGSREVLAQARATIGHLCAALDVDDVSAAIPLPRRPRRAPRPLEPADRDRLVAAAWRSGIAGTAVLTLLGTAMRRSEACQLAWENIDLAGEQMTFWRPKVRDWHTVELHPALASHLEPRAGSGERWVFPGRNGGHVPAGRINEWVAEVAAAAGVTVTPHRLRHTALSDVYDATGDLRAAMELAGHTSPGETARYTRSTRARARAAVRAIPLGGDAA